MGFLGIYKAVYDYTPQSEGELLINEGDLLYVLEKNTEDDWWRAKKKAGGDDEDEPEGLIPSNYIQEAQPTTLARALFEYTRQTDEELSFPEDASLEVFDTSDPDWILVGLNGEYGFAPSNYIELQSDGDAEPDPEPEPEADFEPAPPDPPSLPARPTADPNESLESSDRRPSISGSLGSPVNNPAAVLAGVMAGRTARRGQASPISPHVAQHDLSEASEDEEIKSPALPVRPISQAQAAPRAARSEELQRSPEEYSSAKARLTPGGFHMYNINEMVSVMGRRQKMPTTLGINLGTGVILVSPERAQDGPSQEWTADRMTHYSREGKHVFLELVRPSKSVDFHAGAKDTAEEIVSALGELAGAVKAEGLREVILAGTGQSQKRGQVLYDFMAQGDDEVTVAVGDEVIVIDDSKSEEWWQVRRLKNGKEGVVPSSYIEVTGVVTPPPSSTGLNAAKSTVEQNRLEEIRLTKEAVKAANQRDREAAQQVGPGMPLPERGSSLTVRENGGDAGQHRNKRENGRADGGTGSQPKSRSKPDPAKIRTWTDRSKSFSVEAQFLGLKDGKINLHKVNGVKIAVPITKMSLEDLEFVERATGVSLEDDKPLSESRKSKSAGESSRMTSTSSPGAGATIEQPRKPEYDWFQFFLSCDVAVGLCERYAQAFIKDSMDESVLPDVDAGVLRTLGLREGDIIKVMRMLDTRYGRTGGKGKRNAGEGDGDDGASGGLFSGPGGTLRNNTRKGRPAPAVTTSDVVDANAFLKDGATNGGDSTMAPSSVNAHSGNEPTHKGSGFDDDAWDVKPTKQKDQRNAAAVAQKTTEHVTEPAPKQPALTAGMQELSLLSTPLEPIKLEQPKSNDATLKLQPAMTSAAPAQTSQGATPSFFAGIAAHAGAPESSMAHPAGIVNGPLGGIQAARQRPVAPQYAPSAGTLMPPPPPRPLSAPQSAQPSAFSPPSIASMAPQLTGVHPALQGQPAPPGQSLNDMTQARLQQQQYNLQMQPQPTGMNAFILQPQATGMAAFGTMSQPQYPGFMQPMMTGIQQPLQSPFADPLRPPQFPPMQQMQAQQTGLTSQLGTLQSFGQHPPGVVNSVLPPPLIPERTGLQSAPSFQQPAPGFNGVSNSGPIPPPIQPLVPQQTGPPPPVRFGMTGEVNKLAAQPTGRRANLAQATPQNPFGF